MAPTWSRALVHIRRFGNTEIRRDFHVRPHRSFPKVAAVPAPAPTDNNTLASPEVNLNKIFWSMPRSLAIPPGSPQRIEEPNYEEGIRRTVLKLLLFYSKQSISIRGANVIYKRIISQVDKPAIYDGMCSPEMDHQIQMLLPYEALSRLFLGMFAGKAVACH